MSEQTIRWLDLDELMASEPAPVPWVLEPLLARGHVTILAGPAGVGKSLFAVGAASAVAHHAPALAGMAITGGSVVILDAENGERLLHERAHLVELPRDQVHAGIAERFDLRHPAGPRELEATLTELQPALLLLDSLASLAPGLKENEADHVGPVLDRVRRLAHATNTAVLLLHHTRKDGSSYRGGTGIPAAVDVAAIYSRPAGDEERDRRVLDWSHDKGGKMRLGPEPEPHHLRVTVIDGRLTVDPAEPPLGDDPPTKQDLHRQRILEALDEHGAMRQGDLLRAIGREPNDGTGRRALAAAVDAGEVTRDGALYLLADTLPATLAPPAGKGAKPSPPFRGRLAGTPEVAGNQDPDAEVERIERKWGRSANGRNEGKGPTADLLTSPNDTAARP